MGKGRDKRKKAKGASSGQGEVKTARKTGKNLEKITRREAKKAEGGEDDLDVLLARFALEDKQTNEAKLLRGEPPPSARVYASFTSVSPAQKDSDIILYGGEWLDSRTDKLYVKSELFHFHTETQRWTRVVVPQGPPPRTAHQAAVHKVFLYIFGGELTSVNQENFRHYRDTWRLDLRQHSWEQLAPRGGPPARSGHRMLTYRNKLLLFGGFYDDGKKQEYYDDLWEFDTEELRWQQLSTKNSGPAPRGGCQLALHGDTLFCFGGHSVLKDSMGEHDKIHDDIWALDLVAMEWSRVKKLGMAPQPRTSFGLVTHKNSAILFGGVSERAGLGNRVYSENFDELYQFRMEPHVRRWFPVILRPSKQQLAKEQMSPEEEGQRDRLLGRSHRSGSHEAADMALHSAAVRIQSCYRGHVVRKAYTAYKLGGKMSELLYSPATYGVDLSSQSMLKPRARQAPMMAVVKNTLWLMGGIVEVAHTDIYLDDIWCLDLVKLDGWKCVKENTEGKDVFKEEDAEWATGSEDADDDSE